MIEARFTTDAFPMVAVTAEDNTKGRTPKIAHKRRCTIWSARRIIVRLSSFLMESYLFLLTVTQGKTLPYIIVQIQLVFNQFFCFYMNSF